MLSLVLSCLVLSCLVLSCFVLTEQKFLYGDRVFPGVAIPSFRGTLCMEEILEKKGSRFSTLTQEKIVAAPQPIIILF